MLGAPGPAGNGPGSGSASDLGPMRATGVARLPCAAMSDRRHARATSGAHRPQPTTPVGRGLIRSLSLAQRFLLANLAILLVAGLAVGIWVGNQLERSIVDRTASVTALYVESIIEPSVASHGRRRSSSRPRRSTTLDAHLASSALADRVRSLRLWSNDGQVVYSPDAELIGQRFPVDGHLARGLGRRGRDRDGRPQRRGERLGAGALGPPAGDVHPGTRTGHRAHHRGGRVLPATAGDRRAGRGGAPDDVGAGDARHRARGGCSCTAW